MERDQVATDPVVTDPDLYRVVMENDRVRVLEYRDRPGSHTHTHSHPDSVMVTLSSFRRRIDSGGREVEVQLEAGATRWVVAQEHSGENIGDTDTHSIFVEFKESSGGEPDRSSETILGPVPTMPAASPASAVSTTPAASQPTPMAATPVDPPPAPDPAAAAVAQATTERTCTNCGSRYAPTFKFCPECGTKAA